VDQWLLRGQSFNHFLTCFETYFRAAQLIFLILSNARKPMEAYRAVIIPLTYALIERNQCLKLGII